MFKLLLVMCAFTAVLVTGCVTAPQVLVHDQQATSNFKPALGKSSLVVIRKTMFKGSAGTWSIALDGRELSRLSISSYIIKEIEPGEHYLSNVVFTDIPSPFQAKEGMVYYFDYGANCKSPKSPSFPRVLSGIQFVNS